MVSTRFRLFCLGCCLALIACFSDAFSVNSFENRRKLTTFIKAQDGSGDNQLLDDLKIRFRIFQESNAAGSDITQTLANVLAGEYDA
jgi:hypothetical protein